ncbi:MAG: DUF2273 domain-containing protein [Dethiobacteria bacterium]
MEDLFYRFVKDNWGKLLGGLAGLLTALIIVVWGFWKGILVVFLVTIGIYIGAKIEKREIIQDFINRLFERRRF